jgi:hypothetical protein
MGNVVEVKLQRSEAFRFIGVRRGISYCGKLTLSHTRMVSLLGAYL